MLSALLIIPILTFLIFVHELGHYVTARRADMKVEEFGFGLPPRIWGFQRGETLWSINAIPLGGFVRVLGEDGKNYDPRSMQAKTAGQRALFIIGGSLMNFLTAIILVGVLLVGAGESSSSAYITDVSSDSPAANAGWQVGDRFVSIGGTKISDSSAVVNETTANLGRETTVVLERGDQQITTSVEPRTNPPADQGATGIQITSALHSNLVVESVPANSPAADAGLMPGDRIQSVNGTPVIDSLSYTLGLQQHAGKTVDLGVGRNGEAVNLAANVPANIPANSEPLGSTIQSDVTFSRPPVLEIPQRTVTNFFDIMRQMGEGLRLLVTGKSSLSDVAGPIGMGQFTSEIISESSLPAWMTVTNITILLSLNLAILNLLPLPALDGGRLLFVIIEVLRRGKRVAPEKEGVVHFVGLVLLLTLMFAVAFVDIDRIVSGNSLLQ